MQEQSNDLSICPSFNSYSSDGLADLAAKVRDECKTAAEFQNNRNIDDDDDDDDNEQDDNVDDNFEFALADEIYCDGYVRPIFPIFNRDLLLEVHDHDHQPPDGEIDLQVDEASSIRIQLKNLFLQELDNPPMPPSCSSSEADELESIPPGTYCVWKPKRVLEPSSSRCKKSQSARSASSKRWRLRDLLRRSNSDGKDSFVFITPKHRNEKENHKKSTENSKDKKQSVSNDGKNITGKAKAAKTAGGGSDKKSPSAATSAHEAFYVRNRALKEGDKRKSYLPYRQDLLGFFANVHAMGRTFPPF